VTAVKLGEWPVHSPEWFAARVGRVGGSDVGVLMGWAHHPGEKRWSKSRAELMDEKVAELRGTLERPEPEKPWKGARARGHYCEPGIRDWLADREGIEYDPSYKGTCVDSEHDWMMVNPDGVTTDGRLVECKTCDVRTEEFEWGRAGTSKVPLTYGAQATWSMGILGLGSCLMPVLSGAPKFEYALYKIKFDRIVFSYLRGNARRFIEEARRRAELRIVA